VWIAARDSNTDLPRDLWMMCEEDPTRYREALTIPREKGKLLRQFAGDTRTYSRRSRASEDKTTTRDITIR
jgi:hypothetical protein